MRLLITLVALVVLGVPEPALAWHKDGHMAVARIAWQQLGKREQDLVTKILKAHVHDGIDHYKVFLTADFPKSANGITVDEWAFARAAAWPDWVRDPKTETPTLTKDQSDAIRMKFHHGPWHFINLPFVHPTDAAELGEAKLAELTKNVLEPGLMATNGVSTPRHAIAALKQMLKVFQDGTAADADKAVALCWILHLVSDIHQPLHASTLIAKSASLPRTDFDPPPSFDAPEGDGGGNRLAIKLKEGLVNAEVLHAYWDGLVFNDKKDFDEVEAKIRVLLMDPQLKPEKFPEFENATDFLDWAKESLSLAKTVVYREKGTADSDFLAATPLPIVHDQLELSRALHGLKAKVLSAEYQDAATKTAERRIVLAGYRLGCQLKAASP